jgi:hypothetical protein
MRAGGKKAEPRETKTARGTRQKCRDGVDTIETPSPALAISPPELPLEVADVWAEYVEAAIAHGARQCDADSFAEWCTMTSVLRQARNASELDQASGQTVSRPHPAPASYVQQWRQLGELFGLVGSKSRVGGKSPDAAKTNPFARNGRR